MVCKNWLSDLSDRDLTSSIKQVTIDRHYIINFVFLHFCAMLWFDVFEWKKAIKLDFILPDLERSHFNDSTFIEYADFYWKPIFYGSQCSQILMLKLTNKHQKCMTKKVLSHTKFHSLIKHNSRHTVIPIPFLCQPILWPFLQLRLSNCGMCDIKVINIVKCK